MSSIISNPPPTMWSQCSRDELQSGFDNGNLDRCLFNEPTTVVGDAVCGNGILQAGETCDCGSPSVCRLVVFSVKICKHFLSVFAISFINCCVFQRNFYPLLYVIVFSLLSSFPLPSLSFCLHFLLLSFILPLPLSFALGMPKPLLQCYHVPANHRSIMFQRHLL